MDANKSLGGAMTADHQVAVSERRDPQPIQSGCSKLLTNFGRSERGEQRVDEITLQDFGFTD
jgi:hypothetical protein